MSVYSLYRGAFTALLLLFCIIQSSEGGQKSYSSWPGPGCNSCGGNYVSSNPCNTCGGGNYAPAPNPCASGCYNNNNNNGAYSAGHNVGSAVSNAVGGKLSAIAGFFDGLANGKNPNSGCGSSGCGGGGGCGYSGCGSSNHGQSSGGSNTIIVVQQPATSSCGSGGCGSSHSSCGSGGCGSSYSSGGSSHSSYSSGHSSGSSYPNCQCDILYNNAGQGSCNIGARSTTSDNWCYVSNDVNGRWVEAQWACPDSKESTVHHGRYWSNYACRNHGK